MGKKISIFLSLLLALFILDWGIGQGLAQSAGSGTKVAAKPSSQKIKPAERRAAAARLKKLRSAYLYGKRPIDRAVMDPGGFPHYFGPLPNYANSPMPKGVIAAITLNDGGSGYTSPTVVISDAYGTGLGATATATVAGGVVTGISLTNPGTGYYGARRLHHGPDRRGRRRLGGHRRPPVRAASGNSSTGLPGLDSRGRQPSGPVYPCRHPRTSLTYSGSDYYEIELGEYTEKLHTDLPPTTLRGYRQTNTAIVGQEVPLSRPADRRHEGPAGAHQVHQQPAHRHGRQPLHPRGHHPDGRGHGARSWARCYTQNRAAIHLHGGATPWISDGTPHQWITPAGETTSYPKGVSVVNVPDMPDPGAGSHDLLSIPTSRAPG